MYLELRSAGKYGTPGWVAEVSNPNPLTERQFLRVLHVVSAVLQEQVKGRDIATGRFAKRATT